MAEYSIADVYGGQVPEGAGAVTPPPAPAKAKKTFSIEEATGKPLSEPKKKEVSTLQDIMQAQVGMAEHLVSFWDKAAVGLNEATKNALGIDLNAIGERHGFMGTKQVAERAQLLAEDTKTQGAKTTVGGLSTLPAYMATFYPQIVMSGSDMYEELTNKGVDKKTAMKAAMAAVATSILQVVVPFGKGLVKGAASGAGISVGTLLGQNKFMEYLLSGNYPQIAEEYKVTKDDLVKTGVMGLALGGIVGKLTGKKLDTPEAEKATNLFADMSKEDPKGANAVIESTKKVDPKLAKQLQEKVNSMVVTKPKLDKMFRQVKADSVDHSKGVVTESDIQKMFDAGKMAKAQEAETPVMPTHDQAAAEVRNTMRTGYDLVSRTTNLPAGEVATEESPNGPMPGWLRKQRGSASVGLSPATERLFRLGDTTPLSSAKQASEYTSKVLDRLPQNRFAFPKTMIAEMLRQQGIGKDEKAVFQKIVDGIPGKEISAKDLIGQFQLATGDYKLTPQLSNQYASYGLQNINRANQIVEPHEQGMNVQHFMAEGGTLVHPETKLWRLPEHMEMSEANHFSDPRLFGHTRTFDEDGVRHVVEIQSDLMQNAKKPMSEEARGKLLEQTKQAGVQLQKLNKLTTEMDAVPENQRNEIARKGLEALGIQSDPGENNFTRKAWLFRNQAQMVVTEIATKLNAEAVSSQLEPIQKNWPQRLIREELGLARKNKVGVIRFATADTVAKVEGWPRTVDKGDFKDPGHQSIYDRYKREIEPYIKQLGGQEHTDPQGHTWLEMSVPKSDQVQMWAGIPVNKESMKATFELAKQHIPVLKTWEKELKDSYEVSMRAVSPESLGPEAKTAGAITARAVARQAQLDSAGTRMAQARRMFWQKRGDEANLQFLFDFERGKPMADPMLEEARLGYEREYEKVNAFDESKGIKYEARENYLYHTFEDSEGVDKFFNRRYGAQWNDPKFTKQRGFELYHQAIKAGFKPRFTNPEDILLARQHASNIAAMRIETLQDMERLGLGRKVVKGQRPEVGEMKWRAPNGQRYWVHDDASQILRNAFNTQSLWQMKGPVGSAFRGAMGLKNLYVPLKLAISGFHLLHVATIDNYTGMVRASKGLLAGSVTPGQWGKSMLRGATFADTYGNPKAGGQLMQLWRKDPASLSSGEKMTLQYMFDGGFIPEMSSQWKIGALEKFKDAVAARYIVGATARAPMALIEAFQKPMFEVWIPRLKANAYVQDIASAMKANPELVHNERMRIEAFRKIAKSVDNRYGEMAYNTLFMNRTVKDSLVASSLSMGWWLGFLREYGGAGMDLAKGIGSKASVSTLAKQGDLDRALFVGLYTTGSLMLGGLMTYGLSGQTPQGWKDYVYPKSGGKNSDGTDKRISTMFYTREFGGIALHAQEEGLLRGVEQHIANKASPVLGTAKSMVTNLDYFGNEISDPSAPAFQQLQQKLGFAFKEMEPIAFEAAAKGGSTRERVLPFLGLNSAPAYAMETPGEAKIKTMFHTYHSHVTPFVQAQINQQKRELKELYKSGDMKAYNDKLTEVQREHHLSPEQMMKIRKGLAGHHDSAASMFKQLTADEQLKVLKSMSPDD